MDENIAFNQWAIVEIMGHSIFAGRVSEQVIAGASMIRVDVPEVDEQPGYTKFFGPAAIYCITPVSAEMVKATIKTYRPQPISPLMLSQGQSDSIEE